MVRTTTASPHYWGWLLAMGIFLIIIGCFAIATPFAATFASVLVLGWLLIVGGILEVVSAFSYRHYGGFLVNLFLGLFCVLVGILMVTNPAITALTITMLIALLFLTLGIFRIVSALVVRYSNWGWYLFSGILAVILGVLILIHWPSSALWVIGLFIGIDFVITGWITVLLALTLKKLS